MGWWSRGAMNRLMQAGLVFFTMLGFLLVGARLPQYGLIAALISQVFWLYASYRAWRDAEQIGIFINTIIVLIILLWGVANYWL